MDDVRKIDKSKQHFKDHKEAYIFGGLGLVVGVTIGIVIAPTGNSAMQKVIAIKSGDVTQNVMQVMTRPGPKSFVIQSLDDGKIWASINEAAKTLGINAGELSKHLKGDLASVGGKKFQKLSEL